MMKLIDRSFINNIIVDFDMNDSNGKGKLKEGHYGQLTSKSRVKLRTAFFSDLYDNTCVYCGHKDNMLYPTFQIDHFIAKCSENCASDLLELSSLILPETDIEVNDLYNLVVSCGYCNRIKNNNYISPTLHPILVDYSKIFPLVDYNFVVNYDAVDVPKEHIDKAYLTLGLGKKKRRYINMISKINDLIEKSDNPNVIKLLLQLRFLISKTLFLDNRKILE